jgi:NAD(P)-dependent dehydrogenase (short-subunit alcohol dehydrogenase family)
MPPAPNRDRCVLVTGCSSGIGLCLARGLHERGYRVFATARNPDDVRQLAEQGLEALALDLDSSASIEQTADEILRRTGGRLYALINNAGFGVAGAVEDLPRDALRAQFETNVFGAQELTNRLLPIMRQAGEGRIVQISSLLGIVCLAYRGAYNASKFALEALSDTMRLELRGTNIHVVLIEPGPITSDFRSNAAATYRKWINRDRSAHRAHYAAVEARLGRDERGRFELPPQAVLGKVIRALESRRPRTRYPVTLPSHLARWFRRLLPDRMLDIVAAAVSGGGKR